MDKRIVIPRIRTGIIALRAETRLQCEETMEFNIDLVRSGTYFHASYVCTMCLLCAFAAFFDVRWKNKFFKRWSNNSRRAEKSMTS